MAARTLMVQGTGSSVGKSILVAALLRILRGYGLSVAPFKAQNMALNSFVTPDGCEISRAQAVQAEAAEIAPSVEMNPVLLKPEAERRAQVIVMGKPIGRLSAAQYQAYKPRLREVVASSLERLVQRYDLVVIEGAGSPAEINLKQSDIVNMYVAKLADAPVILVGDIDRGGVFAHLVGTMELLEQDERARVAALLINKFRGDRALLEPGLKFIARRLDRPVLGVVPYIENLRIADEDSVALEERRPAPASAAAELDVAVIRLPRLSNYDDLLALERIAAVRVRFVEAPEALAGADLAIVPGSKSTIADLEWMRRTGIARALVARASQALPVLGICGGCQMLGEAIEDPTGAESDRKYAEGLGLLALRTRFGPHKRTAQVTARAAGRCFLTEGLSSQEILRAYEIHMGMVERSGAQLAPFEVLTRNGRADSDLDGALAANGAVVGTMLHGIFDNDAVRGAALGFLRARKGLPDLSAPQLSCALSKQREYDRLAAVVREHIDCALLKRLAGL
jgi:adenosylcobyric acid synthase